MTLRIHRAERTDLLADGLGALLATPLADPFAEELVVVPARGVERWVTQRLSHRLGTGPRGGDGVCAGVRFLSPHSLVAMLLGKERDDVWDPDRMVWPLLEVIDQAMGEPWCAALSAHLGFGVDGEEGDLRRSRRYSVARRLAGLFASYAVQRPALIADWSAGRDTDGAGHDLDDDLLWQPELWRRLVRRVGETPPDVRHTETLERLRSGGDGLELPPRLSLFGHTRLPVTEVELLRALGELRDVHLWLPQASGALWEELAPVVAEGPVPREEDRTIELVGHPLLGSLGRDSRELQRTLAVGEEERAPVVEEGAAPVVEEGAERPSRDHAQAAPPVVEEGAERPSRDHAQAAPPVVEEGAERPSRDHLQAPTGSLLTWLQQDLRANAEPDAATLAGRILAEGDRSVQVHACHGSARQIDVLREVLVGLLEDDPTLEPRDILVMVPDIEAYAPLVHAGFGLADVAGAGEGHPAHRLRVRLADRAPTSINPLLTLAATLVELAGGRVTATEVLDLAATEPVRRRFGFTDDDLAQLSLWVEQAGIRWGLDAHHREAYGLELGDNTWWAGLGRILLGVAMAEEGQTPADGLPVGALPVDDVSGGDIDLAGRFSEYVDRLHSFVTAASGASTVEQWTTALSAAVGRLAAVAPADAWQQAQLDRELARMGDNAGGEGSLLLGDVRHLLAHRLGGRPTRSNFRTGTLTVCTMVPMRSVPHRVVCLVGLDDGVFPRSSSADGDDALARHPMTGERDARSEDRQLFLDAILAARETLVVTYTGANEHTGAIRPPAVPLGELLDALDRTATVVSRRSQARSSTTEEGSPAVVSRRSQARSSTTEDSVSARVLVRHPLQPFDVRNLIPGGLAGHQPFSFDRAALAGATAARAPRTPVTTLVPDPLPPRQAGDVTLEELQQFVTHPVRAFLRSRLDVSSPLEAEETRDDIPISLEGLAKWEIGDRLLTAVLRGGDPQGSLRAERMRGLLPPGELGRRTLDEVAEHVRPLVVQANGLRQGAARTIDVDIDLGGGRRLTGTVSSVFGNRLVTVTYSRLAAKHRLRSWVDLLALSVGHPDESWTAHALGRGRAGTTRALAGPLDHRAEGWLRDLVELYDRGMREPLPLPPKTACAYAESLLTRRKGAHADPEWKARREWETDRFSATGIPGEDADAAHVRAFGHHAPFDCLLTEPRADERWNDAPHRLGQYAWRLWHPLLEHAEKVGPL